MSTNEVIKALKRMGVVIAVAAIVVLLLLGFSEVGLAILVGVIALVICLVFVFIGMSELLKVLQINTEQQKEILEKLNEKSKDE